MDNYKIKEIDKTFLEALKNSPNHGEVTISIFFRENSAYRVEVTRNESVLLNNLKKVTK